MVYNIDVINFENAELYLSQYISPHLFNAVDSVEYFYKFNFDRLRFIMRKTDNSCLKN